MLPDFPSTKKLLVIHFKDKIKKEIMKTPRLASIRREQVFEGNILTITSMDGYSKTTTNYPIQDSEFAVSKEEIIEKGPQVYLTKVPEIAKEIAQKQVKLIINELESMTERTGNVVKTKKGPITQDTVLEVFKKVTVIFDEYLNPVMPPILKDGKLENIREKVFEWNADPNFRRRLTKIIEKKRKEWIDTENNRKLVD